MDRHDRILQDQVGLFAGKVANRAGDGSLSTFENPRRAIECALALQTAWPDLGVETRIGIHFGEVERREDGAVGGVSAHVGARVMAAADRPGESIIAWRARGEAYAASRPVLRSVQRMNERTPGIADASGRQ